MQPTGIYTSAIVENGCKGFSIDGLDFFAVKKNGRLFVYHNLCPHISVKLEWEPDKFLDVSQSMIQCANHGALFVIESGFCVSGPCSGKKLRPVIFDVIDDQLFVSR